jgi:hypothetical protein
MLQVLTVRRLGLVATFAVAAALAGCASGEGGEQEAGEGAAISATPPTAQGFVYFHGMSHLGFDKSALQAQLGGDDLLAPQLSDSQIEAGPANDVLAFLRNHQHGVVSGYSLGRVPVLKMMKAGTPGMNRVVMVDPTYDSASGLGQSIGGGIAKSWLAADDSRTFFIVYGDVTKQLNGDTSYTTALTGNPRAVLCYVPGDHARFREADMAYALVAHDCADLKRHLVTAPGASGDEGDDETDTSQ